MIEKDTIRLLRECDSGIKMGIKSIEDVVDHVKSNELRELLVDCKNKHNELDERLQKELERFKDEGKEPNVMATAMSWIKTNVKLAAEDSDSTVADLIVDGCNMGVKSLNRYLNEYEAADEVSKDIAKRLINIEEKLAVNIRKFL